MSLVEMRRLRHRVKPVHPTPATVVLDKLAQAMEPPRGFGLLSDLATIESRAEIHLLLEILEEMLPGLLRAERRRVCKRLQKLRASARFDFAKSMIDRIAPPMK